MYLRLWPSSLLFTSLQNRKSTEVLYIFDPKYTWSVLCSKLQKNNPQECECQTAELESDLSLYLIQIGVWEEERVKDITEVENTYI